MTRTTEDWKTAAERFIEESTEMSGPFRWQRLHGDGSERVFYRVAGQTGTLVVVRSPVEDDTFPSENDSYVYMGSHLSQRRIPVPEIYGYRRTEGLILLQDLGSVHLQDAVKSADWELHDLYKMAADWLMDVHVLATENLDTKHCFDTPIYDQDFVMEKELKYFHQSFLERALGLKVGWDRLEREYSLLASRAGGGKEQLFFLHRDFQSRNLMLKDGQLYLIDFQGARLGPPQYDLAALLLDPYVQLPQKLQDRLVRAHGERLEQLAGVSAKDYQERYPHVALCRNLQILAAFSFLTGVKERRHFAQYIVPAWKRLRKLITEPPCTDYRILLNLVQDQSDEEISTVAVRLEREALARREKRDERSSEKGVGSRQ
jgi:aminoglycoside/choline kinase family phosphotransferase